MNTNHLLKQVIIELASKCKKYHEFEESLKNAGVSSEDLHSLGIRYVVTHENDFGTSCLFFDDENKAKETLKELYNGRLNSNRQSTNHFDSDGSFAVIIFFSGRHEQETHIFMIHHV